LIDDLLDVSRIITASFASTSSPWIFPHVVQASLDTLRPASEARGIQIHAVIDSPPGVVGIRSALANRHQTCSPTR